MTKKTISFIFFLLLSAGLFAQGFIKSPMVVNAPLIQKHDALVLKSQYRSGGSITDTLPLTTAGFIDDFSYEGPYPDTAKWLDNSVYINRDYPIAPPSLGVATFDGVRANGYPYDFFAGQYSTGKADTLTSKPIDLNLPGDTSVYFSFYYQPQGRGNFPDRDDSLILEFKNVLSGSWDHVWATPGLLTDITDSSWTRVMLHLTNPAYLMKGFQFRFTNWATLSGNGDHWHIDYVYLNNNRGNGVDTVYNDLTFVYNTPSLLNTYANVPWEQYNTSMMKGTYSTTLRNNGPSAFAQFSYRILDTAGIQVNTTYSGGVANMDPYETSGYMNYAPFTSPPLNYTIPALSGKTYYTIESVVGASTGSSGTDRLLANDTVRHLQLFDNFYAYDDNTAELSFGLLGFIHAQLAEKYTTSVDDSLRAVDIYFNPQWTDASQYTFRLKVWNNGPGGAPGSVLYTATALDTPMYNQNGRNQFTRYYLEHPLSVNGGSTIFVGFDQNTASALNIGVDANSNTQMMTYYNTSGTWYNSPFPGSLMIRPIFGTAEGAVGIHEHDKPSTALTVYPNPAKDLLYLNYTVASHDNEPVYSVTDMLGRTVFEGKGTVPASLDISGLQDGVYFIRIVAGSSVSTAKFIISK